MAFFTSKCSQKSTSDVATCKEGPLSNVMSRKRLKLSQVKAWLSSLDRETPIKVDAVIQAANSEDQETEQYRGVAKSLCSMLDYTNANALYKDMNLLCRSSAQDCKIFTGYSATCPSEKYAIKITSLSNKFRVMDVENELKLMKMCTHRNVVEVERAIGHEGTVWITSKFFKNGSLTGMIDSWPKLTESQIAYIIGQVIAAVEHLHSKDIMHLDIKSDNVLVDDDFTMKMTDFGVSVHSPSNSFNEIRGTPYWMAPEVARSEAFNTSYTNKADIWSVGILTWELMFKEPPRFNLDPMDALEQIMNEPAPQIPNPTAWSPELNDFINCMLIKDPYLRWPASKLALHPFLIKHKDDEFRPTERNAGSPVR